MTNERLLNEWTDVGTRIRCVLWDREESGTINSREAAILNEVQRLLTITPIPTKEQVLQWEAERLAERKAKENVTH